MKKIFLLMLICIATSCSTNKGIMYIDTNMKKVNLEMSKKKVISIMGDNYQIINSSSSTYTLGYKSPDNGIYKLVFIDGKLKSWNKEWLRNNPRQVNNNRLQKPHK